MDTKTFVNTLAERIDKQPDEVLAMIDELKEILVESISNGDVVAVPGFGNFEPKMKKERVGTHPSTGKKILVPPKLSIVFKPSALLKQKLK